MKNYAPAASRKKAFSWSYSKIKNYRTCPKRYYLIDVEKKYKEDMTGPDLAWGKHVHTALERRIGNGQPLPADLAMFEPMAQRLLSAPGVKSVERQLAITKDLTPCAWFGDDAWFRAVADFLCVNGPVALAIDYKTGKIIEDSEQLALLAETIFSHYPEVQAVRTEYWWLKDDAVTSQNYFRKDRKKTWLAIWPEINTLEQAHKTMDFPPKTSGLCKRHCAVTECPHNGSNK